MTWEIHNRDVIEWATSYDGPKFHALLCDPPYELGFMGKKWDGSGVAFRPETWAALAEHLRPGAFGMAFASSRGWHRMACAIEDAGLRFHPSIFMYGWNFGSGFPKSTRVGKNGDYPEFEGHRYGGQCLKPSLEPIIVFQKPYEGKPVECITETGAGALWVDGGRVAGAWNRNSTTKDDIRGGNYVKGQVRPIECEPQASHPSGRWPANFVLVHSPECKRVGTKRIKAEDRSRPPRTPNKIYGGGNGTNLTAFDAPVPADGLETVDDWECFKGWTGALPSYEYRSCVLSPSDDAGYLLDRLPSLIEDVQNYSMNGNSLLHDVSAVYHNGRRLSEVSEDDLVHVVSCVLNLSELPSFQFDCQSCHHLCDALLRRVLGTVQDDFPSLPDVLAGVHLALRSLLHNQVSRGNDRQTNWGDSLQSCQQIDTRESNTPDTYRDHSTLLETQPRIQDNCESDDLQREMPESIPENRTCELDNHEIQCCNTCSIAVVKFVSLACIDLAWRFLLPASIIQRNEISVNLPPCPVRLLGEQSGESKSVPHAGAQLSGNGTHEGWKRPAHAKEYPKWAPYADTGTAARFFHQSDWSYEIAEQIAAADPVRYQAKASRRERDAGLDEADVSYWSDGREKTADYPKQRAKTPRRNPHPTVKPIALIKYLATLLLPPEMYAPRRIIVPFCGVSSEMIGAGLAGWEEIVGVEGEEEYCELGKARLRHWLMQPALI